MKLIHLLTLVGLNLPLGMAYAIDNTNNTANSLTSAPAISYTYQLLAVDTDDSGVITEKSLRYSKDAILAQAGPKKQFNDTRASFIDQDGKPQVLLQSLQDLQQFDTNHDSRLDRQDPRFNELSLAYLLINGHLQTVPLADANIQAIDFHQPSRMQVIKENGTKVPVQEVTVEHLGVRQ